VATDTALNPLTAARELVDDAQAVIDAALKHGAAVTEGGRLIDDHQVHTERLAYLATQVRAAHEQTAYAERLSASGLDHWAEHQRLLQGREAWDGMKGWINEVNPRFAVDVSLRYFNGMSTSDEQVEQSRSVQAEAIERISGLLSEYDIICLPTATSAAPRLDRSLDDRQGVGYRLGHLLCIGGMTGCPQITLPLATIDGLPLGLSLMGARGSDEMLIGFAREIIDQL